MNYPNIHGRDSLQTPLRSNSTQPSLNDQRRSLNGFSQSTQIFMSRSSQPEALGGGLTSSRHNSALSFDRLDPQKGHISEDGSGHVRASGNMENGGDEVNFHFLGNQQRVSRGQLPDMPQPTVRSISGLSDMQLFQQQRFYKQLQGLRQHHLPQSNQDPGQQNSVGQFSPFAKQVERDQVPTIVNGTPIHDASNYMWTSERASQIGGDVKLLNGSQPFLFGNSNTFHTGSSALHGLPNGLVLSQGQTHPFSSMSTAAHQISQPTYGSVNGLKDASRNHVHPQYNLHSGGQENPDILNRSIGNQAPKAVMQSNAFVSINGGQPAPLSNYTSSDDVFASKQNFHGRNVLGQIPHVMHNANGGADVGDIQLAASLTRNLQRQEPNHVRQEGWMGKVEEKVTSPACPPQQLFTLGPLEEKTLYIGDRHVWDGHHGNQPSPNIVGRVDMIGARSLMQGNQIEGSNSLSMFPSIQSGSWSSLMQSAVAEASSSDTGLQDECSGLGLQNPEHSTGNPSDLNDSGRLNIMWGKANTQSANSFQSRPLHLFNDTTLNSDGESGLGFQQSTPKPLYDQHGKLEGDAHIAHCFMGKEYLPEECNKSLKEVAWRKQFPQESHMVDGIAQTPLALGNASSGACRSHAYHHHHRENVPRSMNMEWDTTSMQYSWAHHQKPTSMVNFEADRETGARSSIWNINEPLASDGDDTKFNDQVPDPSNDSLVAMHLGRNGDVNLSQADERGFLQKNSNQALPNMNRTLEQARPSSSPPLQNDDSRGNNFNLVPGSSFQNLNQVIARQMMSTNPFMPSPSNNTNNGPGGTPTLNYLNHDQQKTATSVVTDNMWFATKDSLISKRNQKFPMQPMQKNGDATGSRKFLYHPMGELATSVLQPSTMKHELPSQGVQQVGVDVHHAANSEKVHDFLEKDLENNGKGLEDASLEQIAHDSNSSTVSLDARTAFPSQYRKDNSQNMLQLLNRVDHSREKAGKAFASSEYSLTSQISKACISNTEGQGNQLSSSQGFGLRLGPPSGASAVPSHCFPAQLSSFANSGLKSREVTMENVTKGRELQTHASMQTLQHSVENPHQMNWNNKTDLTVTDHGILTTSNQDMNSELQASHSVMDTSGVQYTGNPQFQQVSGAGGHAMDKDSYVAAIASNMDPNKPDKPSPCLVGRAVMGHSLRVETAHKVASVDLYPRVNSDFSSRSPFLDRYTTGIKGQTFPFNVDSSNTRNTSHFVHSSKSLVIDQGSGQQGVPFNSFSTVSHNAWSSIASQRNTSGVSEMLQQGPSQSVNPSAEALNDQKFNGKNGSAPEVGHTHSKLQHLPSREDQQIRESPSQRIPYIGAAISGSDASPGSLECESLLSHKKNDHGNISRHDFSLAMKSSETAPKNAGNGFIEENNAQLPNVSVKTGQSCAYGYDSSTSDTVGVTERTLKNVKNAVADAKNISVSSEEIKSQNANASSHIFAGNAQKGDSHVLERNNSQACPSSRFMMAAKPLVQLSQAHPDPQMASSWFEQFGTYKNGQFVTTADKFAVPQNPPKAVAQQFFFGRAYGGTLPPTVEQRSAADTRPAPSITPIESSVPVVSTKEHAPSLDSSFPDANDLPQVSVKRKKRKRASVVASWNEIVTCTSQGLQSISAAELQWARSTNRLIEKLDDDADIRDDGLVVPGPRKRIIFTTQLIQQIFHPLSTGILSAEATQEYETITYTVAKQLLGDACSLVSSLTTADSQSHIDNMASVKIDGSASLTNKSILKHVEGFIDRARNLEKEFLRLEKGTSMLDVRVECQDLQRFSIIHRFAKFHGGRAPVEVVAADGSATASVVPSSLSSFCASSSGFSTSDAVAIFPRKITPQRYGTAVPMPKNLPEGLQCYSL